MGFGNPYVYFGGTYSNVKILPFKAITFLYACYDFHIFYAYL